MLPLEARAVRARVRGRAGFKRPLTVEQLARFSSSFLISFSHALIFEFDDLTVYISIAYFSLPSIPSHLRVHLHQRPISPPSRARSSQSKRAREDANCVTEGPRISLHGQPCPTPR